MLREAIASGNELGERVDQIMKSGALVSDEIILELILDRTAKSDCANGYLFDGVPRTLGQANLFDQNNILFTHVLELQVENEQIINRMSGRRWHPGSGRTYHITFNPPKDEGIDDETGEPLIQRDDDLPETVKKRLEVYHHETKPLVDFYTNKSSESDLVYATVNGDQSVDDVFQEIQNHI
jgi:adenylate kinase